MGAKPVNRLLLPALLATACLVPTGFGLYRMGEILVTGHFAFDFLADRVDRLPLFVHVLGGLGFLILGASQVLPQIRHARPRMHRRLGRIALPMGYLGAVAGLWMTLTHPGISTALLHWGRIGAASFWLLALSLGLRAILQRDFRRHGRWMLRAYAIALPAGTLPFILLPIVAITGEAENVLLADAIQVAAWPLHVGLAEWIIRRGAGRPVGLLPAPTA